MKTMALRNFAAGQPEVIRSYQKDEYFQTVLKNNIASIVIGFFGPKSWIKYEEEITSFSRFAYVYLTTAYGLQTIGEEYCHLVQVDAGKFGVSNSKQHYLMMMMQFIGPLLTARMLRYLQKWTLANDCKDNPPIYHSLPEFLEKALTVASRLHLAIFYIDGKFYELSKRISGIRYVIIRDFLRDNFARSSYNTLGKLLMLQLAIFSAYHLSKIICQTHGELRQLEKVAEMKPTESSSKRKEIKCPLCLGPASDLTSTPCGHLFCWYCIMDWTRNSLECPVCRSSIQQHTLIYLCQQNF